MVRVLQLGMTDNLGGIESYLINYYRHIDRSEVQFDFINIYSKDLCFQNEIKSLGGNVFKVSSYYKHPFKYMKEVKRIIDHNHYDIVHCNMNSAVMLYPLIAGKISSAKVVIAHSHNSSNDKGILKSFLHFINKHFIPLLSNKYFACSTLAGEWFFNNKIINSKNFFIINNAIDIQKYSFDRTIRNNHRKKFNIHENCLVIGHVGRFNNQKNHKFLIDIFNAYHKVNTNSKLILIGIGPLQNIIKEKVKKMNLEKDVLFLGQRNDIFELYSAMDVFLLPSFYEGLPLVGIEAQVNGLPCLFSANISSELSISNDTNFISINDLSKWISYLSQVDLLHNNTVVNCNYDIIINSKRLENLYKNF